jgi:hypothetical protein
MAVDVSQLTRRGHTLTWCHDEEDFMALKLHWRKGRGAWTTVAPHPVEVDMVGCGVA